MLQRVIQWWLIPSFLQSCIYQHMLADRAVCYCCLLLLAHFVLSVSVFGGPCRHESIASSWFAFGIFRVNVFAMRVHAIHTFDGPVMMLFRVFLICLLRAIYRGIFLSSLNVLPADWFYICVKKVEQGVTEHMIIYLQKMAWHESLFICSHHQQLLLRLSSFLPFFAVRLRSVISSRLSVCTCFPRCLLSMHYLINLY